MKILITGINGFIGAPLSKKLSSLGHEVSGIENKNGGILNKKTVEKAVDNADVVIHLAAITAHDAIVRKKFETLETNFAGTKNVLEAFSNSKSAKKFIYASTGKVYGKIIRLPIDEDHPTSPINILGKSKLLTERLIDFYASAKPNKEFIVFRIFQVFGPNQKNNFLVSAILSQINLEKKEITLGDIHAKRDYVYIDDLIDAFARAVEKKPQEGLSIYNICTGVGSSARDIIHLIEKILGRKIKIKVDKNLLRKDEMNEEYGSNLKAKKSLGWKPFIDLESGLRKMMKEKMQAVILAGGKGTRMQEKYPNVPKLLVPINGKPFLDHLIENLKSNRVSDVLISTGYLGDIVQKYISEKNYGLDLAISKETEPLGTGGAIRSLKHVLKGDIFLLFGDVYSNVNLAKILEFHKSRKALVTAVVHKSLHPKDSNLVIFDRSGKVKNIIAKPHNMRGNNFYNLAALYILSEDVVRFLPRNKKFDFEQDFLIKLVSEKLPVYAYNTREFIMDFGTPERLRKLEKKLAR